MDKVFFVPSEEFVHMASPIRQASMAFGLEVVVLKAGEIAQSLPSVPSQLWLIGDRSDDMHALAAEAQSLGWKVHWVHLLQLKTVLSASMFPQAATDFGLLNIDHRGQFMHDLIQLYASVYQPKVDVSKPLPESRSEPRSEFRSDLDTLMARSPFCRSHKIRKNVDKEAALSELTEWMVTLDGGQKGQKFRNLASMMATMIDELVINSVIHGVLQTHDLDSFRHFQLGEDQAIELKWKYDGRSFGCSVADNFGLMKFEHLRSALMPNQQATVPTEKSTLGLGLKYCYMSCTHFACHVESGKATRFTCLVEIDQVFKPRQKRLRNLVFTEL